MGVGGLLVVGAVLFLLGATGGGLGLGTAAVTGSGWELLSDFDGSVGTEDVFEVLNVEFPLVLQALKYAF